VIALEEEWEVAVGERAQPNEIFGDINAGCETEDYQALIAPEASEAPKYSVLPYSRSAVVLVGASDPWATVFNQLQNWHDFLNGLGDSQ
jgi:hypothetical protein